ncbi:MAG: recombinase family protein [Sphingobacteriales bacterium JAD_PAG50586_3]|nr:MAG: recombinase family protein [Sphingobacteriales bacterium JAD_PAG50586_3]
MDAGIECHFAQEALNLSSPAGRLGADIMNAFATHYSVNLSSEITKGQNGLLKLGLYPWHAPVGYLDMGEGGKMKELDPIKAPLIRKMFELYATQTYSLEALAKKMYSMGLTNSKGNVIRLSVLHKMLQNPFYKGLIRVKGKFYEGRHTPIVSSRLFHQVQMVMKGKFVLKGLKNDFMYRKAIKCSLCNYSLIGELQKGHIYYRCHTKSCPMKTLREDVISNTLSNAFMLVEFYPKEINTLLDLLTEIRENWASEKSALLNSIQLQRLNTQKRLARLTDLLVEDTITKDSYQEKKGEVLSELLLLKEREEELTTQKEGIFKRTEDFLEHLKTLIKTYKKTNRAKMAHLLKIVTSNLSANGKELLITMASPFYEAHQMRLLHYCGVNREMARTKNRTIVFSLIDGNPIKDPPLSKKQLCIYLDYLLSDTQNLCQFNDEDYSL